MEVCEEHLKHVVFKIFHLKHAFLNFLVRKHGVTPGMKNDMTAQTAVALRGIGIRKTCYIGEFGSDNLFGSQILYESILHDFLQ